MKNKKGQETIEFLMTYGWALLVVLLAIAALAYFGVFENLLKIPETEFFNNETKHMYVCNNLDYIDDNGNLKVYPGIIDSKFSLESGWSFRVIDMYGNTTYPKTWDENGVMCAMPVEICDIDNTYCMKIDMIISVPYRDWENWHMEVE